MASQISASETSVLLFSSKIDEINNQSNEGLEKIEGKQQPSSPGEPEQKDNLTKSICKVIIETRDTPITTTVDRLIKLKIASNEMTYLRNGIPIWLDFRSSEVHDFLDVVSGRKHYLRNAEHVNAIAKTLG